MSKSAASVRLLSVTVALLLLAAAAKTSADPDLWGHLKFGLDTVRTHTVPSVYPYAFTQDRPWTNHEYGGEIPMALAYLAGGIAGLALLKGALVFAALYLVWAASRGADFPMRVGVLGLVVLGTGSITAMLRPQLWSLLFIGVLCHVLMSDDRRRRRWLPPLFFLWANLHGGWVLGIGLLGVFAAVDVLLDRRRVIEWTVVVVASAAATLVTPFGLTLWHFVWETVGFSRDITEWQPLWRAPLMNWLPCAVAAAAVAWAWFSPHPRRRHATAMLIVLAYATLRVSRIGPMFVEAAAILLAPPIIHQWPKSKTAGITGSKSVIITMAGAVLGAAIIVSTYTLTCIEIAGGWIPPTNALRLLMSAQPGRLVTFFDWGEYAIWHLGPRLLVSMDGEREAVYSETRLAEHNAILNGDDLGTRTLDEWQAEYVWLPARSGATKQWLAAHGYRIELDDAVSFVAVRRDLPVLASAATGAGRRCFPE